MSNNNNEVKGEIILQYPVKATNPFDLTSKKKLIGSITESLTRLQVEDLKRIEAVVKQPSALSGLKKHWTMLRAMFSLK